MFLEMATRRGPELQGVYRNEVERVLHEDAFECAFRAGLYKFGRLSNRRIVELLRATARQCGVVLSLSDRELLDRWFTEYSGYYHRIKTQAHRALRRAV